MGNIGILAYSIGLHNLVRVRAHLNREGEGGSSFQELLGILTIGQSAHVHALREVGRVVDAVVAGRRLVPHGAQAQAQTRGGRWCVQEGGERVQTQIGY